MYAAMPYKQLRETNHQQTQNHCMMDFQFFHENYILPLSETYVTSTNSSVFLNTGKRSASGEKKTNKTVTCHRNTEWQNWIQSALRHSFFQVDNYSEQGFEELSPRQLVLYSLYEIFWQNGLQKRSRKQKSQLIIKDSTGILVS